MKKTHVPITDTERGQCLEALGPLDDPTVLAPVVAAVLVTTAFAAVRASYVADRAAATAAEVQVGVTRLANAAAVAAFDAAFRIWENTVVDAAGKALTKALSVLLGDVPSTFLARKPRTKLDVFRKTLEHLDLRPDLAGAPDKLADLRSRTDALAVAVPSWEAAPRASKAATATLDGSRAAFDKAYMQLVDAMVKYDPEAGALLPVFFRSDGDPTPSADPTPDPVDPDPTEPAPPVTS